MALRFMDNVKTDKHYAAKIVKNINVIQRYIANKSYEEFMADDELIDAIMFRFIQLIENIKNVSDEFKEEHNDIPWGEILGFRNGIVHEYGKTDYTIVYETATQDLENLKALFKRLTDC